MIANKHLLLGRSRHFRLGVVPNWVAIPKDFGLAEY